MSDAQGQSLLNFLDTPLLVGDPEGRVVFANEAFVRELTPNGEVPHGESLAQLFAGGGREAVLASVAEVCSKGKSVHFRIREGGRGLPRAGVADSRRGESRRGRDPADR